MSPTFPCFSLVSLELPRSEGEGGFVWESYRTYSILAWLLRDTRYRMWYLIPVVLVVLSALLDGPGSHGLLGGQNLFPTSIISFPLHKRGTTAIDVNRAKHSVVVLDTAHSTTT